MIVKLRKKHHEKVHFIPIKYRIFGGLLHSMNIQFTNFLEVLMMSLIKDNEQYEIIEKYSGIKNNKFSISNDNEILIDKYITKCQYDNVDINIEFPKLLNNICNDMCRDTNVFKHDIDLLFRDKITNKIYYVECKYNDDHDTGKFMDISRKFIKTYAYLARELNINKPDQLVPVLFYFNNKKLKGNIYIPENKNIKRGKVFFEKFLSIKYEDVDEYIKNISERKDVIDMFDNLYKDTMKEI